MTILENTGNVHGRAGYGTQRTHAKGAGAGRRRRAGQLSGGRLAGFDGAGLAPADHYRHQRGRAERCHVRTGPVRDRPGYVADHPQPGCDGTAGGKRRPFRPASVSAPGGKGRRHGRDPAGGDCGAGAGRGRAAGSAHPVRHRDGGAARAAPPGADAGGYPRRAGAGLPDGFGGLLPRIAGAADRRGKVSGRRVQR